MAARGITQLLAQIIANIYQNTANEISGQDLQDQLIDIVDSLNKGTYNNSIPYNAGQSVIIDDGGLKKIFICITNTTAGESPISTPAKWNIASGSAGVILNSIELDISSLKAVTGYTDDDQILVNSNNGLYGFSSASTSTPDDDLVVKPDDITLPAPGRWLKIKVLVDTTTTGVIGDLISPITTNLIAAINGIVKNSIEIVDNITTLKAIPSNRRDFKTIIVRFYDTLNEGAVSGGVHKILFYKGVDITNTNWTNLSNWFSLLPNIGETFVSTATNLQGIPSGTTISENDSFNDIIRLLLNPYIPSSISSATLQNSPLGIQFEVGSTVDIDSITITVVDDSEGDPPLTLNIGGTGYNVSATVGVNAPPSPLSITKTIDDSEVWTITGTDGDSDPINEKTLEISWLFKHFVGASNVDLTSSSTPTEVKNVLDVLQNRVLRESNSASISTTSTYNINGYYTYISYATKYGTLNNIILNKTLDVLDSFTEVGDFDYVNVEGHTESYKLYKSNATGAFEDSDELLIEYDIVNPDELVEVEVDGMIVSLSNNDDVLTPGMKESFRILYNFEITGEVYADLVTVSSSGSVVVDIKKNGVSIFSTRVTIDANSETSLTSSTPFVLSDTILNKYDKLTFHVDSEGTGAMGLKMYITGNKF